MSYRHQRRRPARATFGRHSVLAKACLTEAAMVTVTAGWCWARRKKALQNRGSEPEDSGLLERLARVVAGPIYCRVSD
jgi:hypothetical protein